MASARILKILGYLFIWVSTIAMAHQPILKDHHYFFAAIGDFGDNNAGEKAVSDILHQYNPQFIITQGDNNYPNGCWKTIDDNIGQYYHDYIYPYVGKYGNGAKKNRFYPTLGNHDWRAKKRCLKNGTLPYLIYFQLPNNGRYYTIHEPYVDIFVLDSDPKEPSGIKVDSTQFNWFKDAVKHSQAPFKIVTFHHPPYSSGKHGSTKEMRWPFKRMGIDLVLTGHEHNYERLVKDGIHYVINGLGGPSNIRGKGRKTDPDSIIFYNQNYGFLLFDVSRKQIKVNFINASHRVIDTFILKRK